MALETASGKKAGITRQKYYDPIRGEQLGYAFDGRVFEDEALSKRIPVGSVVPTLGGTFLLTDQGSVRLDKVGTNTANMAAAAVPAWSYNDRVATGGLLSQYENAARKASVLSAEGEISALLAQKPDIQREYDQLARKAYQAYRTGQGALANRLASTGLYHSGYADTLASAYETAYQEQLGENERARSKAIAELEQQILRQKTAQKVAEQQAAAEMAKQRLSQYNTEQSLALRAEENRLAEEWRQKNYEAAREDALWNRAYTLEKDAAKAKEASKNSATAKSTTGNSSDKPEKAASLSAIQKAELDREARSLANTFYKNGNKFQEFLQYLGSDSVRKMYADKYGTAGHDYLIEKAIAAYDEKKEEKGDGISLSAAQVQALATSLLSQLAAGTLTASRLKEYLNTAGFDKNTKTLLELYLSGAQG